jgi:hypothetical protein
MHRFFSSRPSSKVFLEPVQFHLELADLPVELFPFLFGILLLSCLPVRERLLWLRVIVPLFLPSFLILYRTERVNPP